LVLVLAPASAAGSTFEIDFKDPREAAPAHRGDPWRKGLIERVIKRCPGAWWRRKREK
jgi:hypothetical protein